MMIVHRSEIFGDGGDEASLPDRLNQVAAGTPRELVSVDDFGKTDGQAPEELMSDLARGDWFAPHQLRRFFLHDRRVRPAVVRAVLGASLHRLSYAAAALGFTGGRGAVAALRRRLHDITAYPEPRAPFPYGNAMAAVAEALLRLDPAAADAARALIDLLGSHNRLMRSAAIQGISEVYRRDSCTEAMALLGGAIESLLDSEDARMFLQVAWILADEHFEIIRQRCADLMEDPDYETRQLAVLALVRVPPHRMATTLAMLAQWAPSGEPLGLALWAASLALPLLSREGSMEIVRRSLAAEAAEKRHKALTLAEQMDHEIARPLIEEALRDEPDPFLQKRIGEMLTATWGSS